MSKSTFTKTDKPRLATSKFADAAMLREHILNHGGFLSRGKALRVIRLSTKNSDTASPNDWCISCWIVDDAGKPVTRELITQTRLADTAKSVAIADDDRGGNAWRFSFVDIEYS